MVYDFIIVGSGIAGASLAYRLPKGKTALILEQEPQPGYHSTGRSAAMFIETYGTPTIRSLTVASNEFYTNPPAGFVSQDILTPRGVLYIATAEQSDLMAQSYKDFMSQGLDVKLMNTEQALAMVPCLQEEKIIGAIYDNAARDIDVHTLHQGFLKAAKANGVELLANARLSKAEFENHVWKLSFDNNDQTVHGRQIVNAAGAWADHIASICGVNPVGIQPKRRSAFLFNPPNGVDHTNWPAVIDIGENFYFKPDAGMLFGSPANQDPVPAHDVVAEELDVATGIYHIEEVTNLHINRPSHTWAGLRNFAPDGEFVIGKDPVNNSFFWLAGQGGYGIQTAAGASQLAVDLLLENPVAEYLAKLDINPEVVSPSRFN